MLLQLGHDLTGVDSSKSGHSSGDSANSSISSIAEAAAFANTEDSDRSHLQPCVRLPMAVLETEYSVGYVFYPPAHCDFHCEVRIIGCFKKMV